MGSRGKFEMIEAKWEAVRGWGENKKLVGRLSVLLSDNRRERNRLRLCARQESSRSRRERGVAKETFVGRRCEEEALV